MYVVCLTFLSHFHPHYSYIKRTFTILVKLIILFLHLVWYGSPGAVPTLHYSVPLVTSNFIYYIIDASSANSVAKSQQGSKRRNLGIKLILLYSGGTLRCN